VGDVITVDFTARRDTEKVLRVVEDRDKKIRQDILNLKIQILRIHAQMYHLKYGHPPEGKGD
jgi:hypothetical protein